MCGTMVTHVAGDPDLVPITEEERPFQHKYVGEPPVEPFPSFTIEHGFKHQKRDTGFKRWQNVVQEVAEAAIYDGRVTLCPICNTPIITKSDKSRTEFCCLSHKTIASKRRRNRAHQLYQMGVTIEDAIIEIGVEYADSVRKWYQEAKEFATPAQ